jgi:rRNA-processing protein FCF1
MYSEENKSSNLAKLLSSFDYVFVDTCSLMDDGFPAFMDVLEPSREYWKGGLHVIIPNKCVEELKKHSRNREDNSVRISSARALKIIRKAKWHRIFEITKRIKEENFADNVIFTTVSTLRIRYRVLIITQDKTLATDLKKLNDLDSQHGRYVTVDRINLKGELEENPGETGPRQFRENVGSIAPQNQKQHIWHGLFHRGHENVAIAAAPLDQGNELVVSADKRLSANLGNPNYSLDKKVEDIMAQLLALGKLAPEVKAKLSLAYTEDQLEGELAKLKSAPTSAKTVSPAEHHEVALAPLKTSFAAPIKVASAPVSSAPLIKRAWFEYGSSVEEAIRKCGIHYGILFRDASIPYVKQVHGPYDLTSKDLVAASAKIGVLAPLAKADATFGPITVHVERADKDYKATLEIATGEKVPSAPVPAPIVVAVSAPVYSSRKEEPKAPVDRTQTSRRRAPRKKAAEKPLEATKPIIGAPQTITSPSLGVATPHGATLIVGVPDDKNKREYIERKSKRLESGPSLEIVKHQRTGKKPAETPLVKKEEKSASKPITSRRGAPKKAQANPVSSSSSLLDAQKAEQRLNSNLNNPNYPKEQKVKDLNEQLNRLRSLKASESQALKYSAEAIKQKINDLSR